MRLAISRPSEPAERKSLYMKLVEATIVYAILFFFALASWHPLPVYDHRLVQNQRPALLLARQFAGAGANYQ